MAGQWIDIAAADGGTFKGYLTVPASGSGPGILLLQEIFGVNSSMREVADYYAEEGEISLERAAISGSDIDPLSCHCTAPHRKRARFRAATSSCFLN